MVYNYKIGLFQPSLIMVYELDESKDIFDFLRNADFFYVDDFVSKLISFLKSENTMIKYYNENELCIITFDPNSPDIEHKYILTFDKYLIDNFGLDKIFHDLIEGEVNDNTSLTFFEDDLNSYALKVFKSYMGGEDLSLDDLSSSDINDFLCFSEEQCKNLVREYYVENYLINHKNIFNNYYKIAKAGTGVCVTISILGCLMGGYGISQLVFLLCGSALTGAVSAVGLGIFFEYQKYKRGLKNFINMLTVLKKKYFIMYDESEDENLKLQLKNKNS